MQKPSPVHPTPAAGPACQVDGALVIGNVEAWRARLAAQIAGGPGLLIDLATTTALDAFGLQLLCAARRSAVAAGKSFALTGTTAVFAQACAAAGLSAETLNPLPAKLP